MDVFFSLTLLCSIEVNYFIFLRIKLDLVYWYIFMGQRKRWFYSDVFVLSSCVTDCVTS